MFDAKSRQCNLIRSFYTTGCDTAGHRLLLSIVSKYARMLTSSSDTCDVFCSATHLAHSDPDTLTAMMATDGRQGARETAMNAAVAKATYDVAVRLLQPAGATVR